MREDSTPNAQVTAIRSTHHTGHASRSRLACSLEVDDSCTQSRRQSGLGPHSLLNSSTIDRMHGTPAVSRLGRNDTRKMPRRHRRNPVQRPCALGTSLHLLRHIRSDSLGFMVPRERMVFETLFSVRANGSKSLSPLSRFRLRPTTTPNTFLRSEFRFTPRRPS